MTELGPILKPYGGSLEQLRASLGVDRPVSAQDLIARLPLGYCDFVGPPPSIGGGGITPLSYGLKGTSLGKSQLTWTLLATDVNGVPMLPTVANAFAVWASALPTLGFAKLPDKTANCDISIDAQELGPPNPANGNVK